MNIDYQVNKAISAEQFQDLLVRSTLGERRPVEDLDCLNGMLSNSNLIVTAWDSDKLVGISRSVTDFHFCCYLCDLAVDTDYQKQGIGKKLQVLTQDQLGPRCTLILIAAPAAQTYYAHIGLSRTDRCWLLGRDEEISV